MRLLAGTGSPPLVTVSRRDDGRVRASPCQQCQPVICAEAAGLGALGCGYKLVDAALMRHAENTLARHTLTDAHAAG